MASKDTAVCHGNLPCRISLGGGPRGGRRRKREEGSGGILGWLREVYTKVFWYDLEDYVERLEETSGFM